MMKYRWLYIVGFVFVPVVAYADDGGGGLLGRMYQRFDKWVRDLIDGLMAALNQWIIDMNIWVMEICLNILRWVLEIFAVIISPVVNAAVELLPNPSGVGFRYIFEAYHFASAWFDVAAFRYVILLLLWLHLLMMLVNIVSIALVWVWRALRLIPFV